MHFLYAAGAGTMPQFDLVEGPLIEGVTALPQTRATINKCVLLDWRVLSLSEAEAKVLAFVAEGQHQAAHRNLSLGAQIGQGQKLAADAERMSRRPVIGDEAGKIARFLAAMNEVRAQALASDEPKISVVATLPDLVAACDKRDRALAEADAIMEEDEIDELARLRLLERSANDRVVQADGAVRANGSDAGDGVEGDSDAVTLPVDVRDPRALKLWLEVMVQQKGRRFVKELYRACGHDFDEVGLDGVAAGLRLAARKPVEVERALKRMQGWWR